MTLTLDQISEAARMWAGGMSGSQIAAAFGVTRNTILGHAFRRKWPPHPRIGNNGNGVKPKLFRRREKAPKPKRNWHGGPPVVRLPSKPKIVPVPVGARPVSLLERRPHQCAWPLDERTSGPETLMCGAPVARGSYCAAHHRAAYQPPEDRRRWDRSLGIAAE